ncbi:MAG: large-conductance mechanosensitive channel protein MscL [Anaerolineales bacterium]|nr:large-conductance mechanosensitive channel protein MscL [Anaerolineales bacterium]
MLKEFMQFIKRGNVLDLAVAVIIGAAFGAIVTSLVNDLLMPLIGIVLGGVDFTSLAVQVDDATLTYGNFIQAVINFLAIAFVVFLLVRQVKKLERQDPPPPPKPAELSTQEKLLVEIRDLLKQQAPR